MEYRTLGRTGCAVSSLCLGTMTFGRESDEATSHAQLDRFVEVGGNFIDTADVYSGTESESIIGRWLADRPNDVTDGMVIATKGRFPTTGDMNGLGLSRRHLDLALDASLARLGVDTIDLYQVHAWDPVTPLDETLRFFQDAVAAGKIRYFGLSNFTGWQLQKAVDTATFRGWPVPVTLQPQYSLLVREIEWEIVPACLDGGLGLLPWSPLGGGWLTGKYQRDEEPTGENRLGEGRGGMEAYDRRSTLERTWDVVDTVRDIADAHEVSMAQIALAWLLGRPAVSSVILGVRTMEQLDDNLASVDVRLSDDDLERLDAASDPGAADYPYGEMGSNQRNRTLDPR